jgi:hypothetical protein
MAQNRAETRCLKIDMNFVLCVPDLENIYLWFDDTKGDVSS